MTEKIAILMSTYNGEHFLSEQIESIQEQTNKDWQLYIRDDGSSDRTREIIQDYVTNDSRITFVNQDDVANYGVIRSFMDLLSGAHADFYMFADQDDVWKKDKVDRAVSLMKQNNYRQIPICLHTELQIVDNNLQPMDLMKKGRVWDDFQHFMFGNCVTGCTVMINQKLKDKLRLKVLDISQLAMHDWWLADIAAAFGRVIYDQTPTILYRQHIDNTVGGEDSQSPKQLIYRFFNPAKELKDYVMMVRMLNEFNRLYGNEIKGKDAEYLKMYAGLNEKSSLLYNARLALKLPPKRSHLRGQLLLDYLMIVNNKSFLKL